MADITLRTFQAFTVAFRKTYHHIFTDSAVVWYNLLILVITFLSQEHRKGLVKIQNNK